MVKEIFLLVGDAGTLAARAADLIVNTPTADIYIGQPPIDIHSGPRHEPIIPFSLDCPLLERRPKRDWEQRNRKRRR